MFTYKSTKSARKYLAKLIAFLLVLALVAPMFPQPAAAATDPWDFVPHVISRISRDWSQGPTNPMFTDYMISLSGHAGNQNYSISVMRVENGSTAASVAAELNDGIESQMVEFIVVGNPSVDANDNPNIYEFEFMMEVRGTAGLSLLLEDELDVEDGYVVIDDDDVLDDSYDDVADDDALDDPSDDAADNDVLDDPSDDATDDALDDPSDDVTDNDTLDDPSDDVTDNDALDDPSDNMPDNDLGNAGDTNDVGNIPADPPAGNDPGQEQGIGANNIPQSGWGTEPSGLSHLSGGAWGSPGFNMHGLSTNTSGVSQPEPDNDTNGNPGAQPGTNTNDNPGSEPGNDTNNNPGQEPDNDTNNNPQPDNDTSDNPQHEPDTDTNDYPEDTEDYEDYKNDEDTKENLPVVVVPQPQPSTIPFEPIPISPLSGNAMGTPILNIHGGGTFTGGSIVLGWDYPPMPGGFESLLDPVDTIHFTWPRAAVAGSGSELGLLRPGDEYLYENGTIREEFRDSPVIVTVAIVITPLGFDIERTQGNVTYSVGNFTPILESDVIIVVFDYNLPPPSTGDPLRDAAIWQAFQDLMFNMRFVGDPIDAFSGNFYWYYTDLTIHSDPPMHFTRFYNSQDDHVGMLGRGWRHNFYIEVVEDDFGVKLVLPSGSEIDFFFDTRYSTPTPPHGWEIDVVLDGNDEEIIGYDIRGPGGIGYTVRDGLVTEIYERGRRMYTISHTGDTRRVTRVDTGAWFDISPLGVTDSTGRTVTFTIVGDFLTRTTNPDGNSLIYTYTPEGFIESIVDFMGVNLLTNEYMAHGRVSRQSVPGIPDTFYEYRYDGTRTYFTDKNGVEWIYSFAGTNNPVRIADENGQTVMTYNDYGMLTSITDRMGLVTTFEYEGLNLIAIHYPDGTSVHLTYDANGVLTSQTDRNGFTTYFNNSGTVDRIRDGNGNTTTFNRDTRNHLTSIVDREGRTTTITTNHLGNPTHITTPDGQTTVNTYDDVGRLTSTTTPMGRTTSFIYTPAGKLQEVIDPDGVSTVFVNNENGFTTLVTNRMGHSMAITYNESGQITSMTDFSGNETTQTFNEFGNLAEIRTPMGGVTRFGYDQYDNLTNVTNPIGGRAVFEYDLENRLTSHTDHFNNRTAFTYNALGQVSVITAPNGGSTAFTYDAFGRILTQTDALGGVTRFTYDGNGNLLTMTDPMGNVTRYAYDREDRLVSITNALNEVTRFEYDTVGRLVRIIDAMDGVAELGHDHDGMLTSRTDEESRVTSFEYDQHMGRIISRTDPDGEVTTFMYDLNGRITSVHNPGQTQPYHFEYDANGNLTQVTDPMDNVTTFVYDSENRLISETDPMGHVTTFAYDYAGNLTQVVDALSGTITMTYDRMSRMTSITNQNGVRTDITYDAMGNIARIRTGNLAETRYEYDMLGNLTRAIAVDSGQQFATLFAYDANGNLVQATDPNGNVTSYTHDELNRVSTITNAVGGVFHITYDALGRVSKIVDEEGAETHYFYDRTGLLTSIRDALGNYRLFTHDEMGRITSETDENGVTRYFEYDQQGNVTRFVNGEGQDWLYSYDELGRMVMVQGPLPTRHTTRYEHDALGRVTGRINDHGHIRTFSYDALSRITSVTDEMGNVTQYRYDGVGNVVEVIDPLGNSIHYYYDGLNRLVRVNAEWSNPITGASGFQQTIYQFNGRGLLVTEINALGAEKTHEYDPAGNAIITIDEDGNVIRREFNELNLVSAVTATSSNSNSNAENVRLGFVYDKTGRLVSMTDATGETNFLLDPLYRIIEVQDSFGRVTAYEHDPVGNLLSITHPDNSVVTYTHNRNNQVLTITDPDGGETRNVYDSYGRLTRQYLPNGGRTEFAYNSLNQLTQQREIFNGRTTRQFIYGYTDNGLLHNETIQFFGLDNVDTTRLFRYDANGQMISSTDTLLGRADLEYDSLGNLIRETRDGAVTTFTHNAMNQLLTRTGPDGHFTYTYDQRGNLISESRNGATIRTFEYDTLSRMMKGTNAIGETSEYMYNALGLRVANVQRILPGHMGGHGWDVNGYLTDTPNSPGSHYIDVNRMALAGLPTSVWLDGFASTDGLDSSVLFGDTGSTNSAGSTGGMNSIDRYLWQGELPEDIPEGAHQRIFKDNFGLNRNSGVVRQEFVIDYVMGFNQDLMLVEEGGFSTVFVYGTPLQRLSQHTSRADSIVSGIAAVGGALDPGGNVAADIAVLPVYAVLYYRLDFRNSTSQMQLPNGQYIAWAGFDEWGATTSPTDHDMNMAGVDPIQFGSYNFDRILGLYYAQRRFYDPHARRFTQPDPKWHTGISGGNSIWGDNPTRMPNAWFLPDIYAILQSTNLYAYCMNDPVNFIDPTGLSAAAACFGGGNPTVKGPSLPPLPAHIAPPRTPAAPRVTPAHNPPPLQNAVLQDTVGTPTGYSEPFGCDGSTAGGFFSDYFTGGNRWGTLVGGAHAIDTALEYLTFDPNDPRNWRKNAIVRNHASRARLMPGIVSVGTVGLDIRDGVQGNRAAGESANNIASDIAADVVVSGVGVGATYVGGVVGTAIASLVTGGTKGAVAGSAIPIPLVGTLAGLVGGAVVGGIAFFALDTATPGGYTVREHTRNAFRNMGSEDGWNYYRDIYHPVTILPRIYNNHGVVFERYVMTGV